MEVIECVANVSTSDPAVIDTMCAAVAATGAALLDLHTDADHNRTVLSMAGPAAAMAAAATALAACCVDLIDLALHAGVHPRIGALDVCPFVPLGFPDPSTGLDAATAVAEDAGHAIAALGLPVFAYDRLSPAAVTLPHVRRDAFGAIAPTWGPRQPHPRAGATAVGVRDVLVAFNVDIAGTAATAIGLDTARAVASAIRESNGGPPGLRALGLDLAGQHRVQVSMNLTRPWECGLADAWHAVEAVAQRHRARPVRGEVVGLVPAAAVIGAGEALLDACALGRGVTLEAALAAHGLRSADAGPLRLPVLPDPEPR